MRVSSLLSLFAGVGGVVAGGANFLPGKQGRYVDAREKLADLRSRSPIPEPAPEPIEPRFLNAKTSSKYLFRTHICQFLQFKVFSVNGSALPEVDFDIGESYAGLLPISSQKNESRQLYFWYFPSSNPAADEEITIWLNGGPGCSSLEGLFQENGPVLWQYGTRKPVPNPWTWVNLTNVLWVEQPVGTGFSQGVPDVKTEAEVAQEFMGFFKNFVDTFDLQNRKVYITGESYAGMYVPHIASAMLDTNDTTYFGVEGIMIYDPSINSNVVMDDMTAVPFVNYWSSLFGLNDTYMDYLNKKADSCGYTSYLEEYLVYPPKGILPTPPNLADTAEGCGLALQVQNAAQLINPVRETCDSNHPRLLLTPTVLGCISSGNNMPTSVGRSRLPG